MFNLHFTTALAYADVARRVLDSQLEQTPAFAAGRPSGERDRSPEEAPVTRLDLEPRVLFAPRT